MKRGKNEKVWFCLEAGWKIWYDNRKAAGREEEIRRAKNGKNRSKGEVKKLCKESITVKAEAVIKKNQRGL
ncbi:hypothetical protein LI187_05855 [bacterium 210820-DFI.6.38]|nr:hypothetical protein [bacterium 210820-DFI.6.38]